LRGSEGQDKTVLEPGFANGEPKPLKPNLREAEMGKSGGENELGTAKGEQSS